MIKSRQKLGKYRIEKRLGEGGFATVFKAMDTIEGIHVALKIPHDRHVTEEVLADFRHEVRLAARLDHPHILRLKNAEFISGHFVITFPLGERTLAERLSSRMSLSTILDYAEQMLEAVSHAHKHRVIHCDVKPENLILFDDNTLRLTDFGIAKVALRTIRASGSGTVGYIAPEQAMGQPSFRSDVFSMGLVLYRMLTGSLPEWPFEWPPPGFERLRGRIHSDLVAVIRRAIEIDPRIRYHDAGQMLKAFQRVKARALRYKGGRSSVRGKKKNKRDWRTVRHQQFQRHYGKALETRHRCKKCNGPVSETMKVCPWCGSSRKIYREKTNFPSQCPRCHRGMKLDWEYCPWCHGAGFQVRATRDYTDVRYQARCNNPSCSRKDLMPFMRYCPWCRRKVKRKWKIPGSNEKCSSCGWGVLRAFWNHCPWCCKSLAKR